jgi:2-polyprenyl-3-methyl-5-hydroxy-6-metoxy-1,4-benzoquinol methylase
VCPTETILDVANCSACGHRESTLVGEFNRFALLAARPDRAAACYDYRLCHRCGIAYASKRPAGARYRWLFEHFEETLGRGHSAAGAAGKLTQSSFELTDEERDEIRRRAQRGVFVSDHEGVARKDHLPLMLADRLVNAPHAELLTSLLQLRSPRVLEIRSRAGAIGASLKRQWNADVSAMALFDNQRCAIQEVYGFAATHLIDFDAFEIPDDDPPYDLIVANHMVTHAVRPRDFLACVRRHLRPNGYLYLYNEPDDAEYLLDGKSMFNTLNAFHLQAFDGRSLTRALAANGFTVKILTRQDGHFMCLCEESGAASWEPMGAQELERRRARYLQARDAAILMMPPHARSLAGAEWDLAVDRAFSAGLAYVREDGAVRFRRRRDDQDRVPTHRYA